MGTTFKSRVSLTSKGHLSVNQVTLEDLFRGFTTEDLEAMLEIYDRYGAVELVESGEVSRVAGSA
ncbi:MAG TPA: hypothetical protein VLA69_02765 [Gaiellaceae bacterium]|nr:hypothetical protein [Gaiellaceae bacterium]